MRWLTLLLLLLGAVVSPTAAAQEWAASAPREAPELPVPPAHWTTVPGTFLRVHGPEAAMPLMLRIARHGSESLPELAERLRVPIGETVHVYIASTDQEFRDLQPGQLPVWADATAWPNLGAIFLRTNDLRVPGDEPIEQVFDHELTHVLLGRAFAPMQPPTWLQEGVAQHVAGQVGAETARTLADASGAGVPFDLASIERHFPDDPWRARVAYAQAADFVTWLEATHGAETLPELIAASARGGTMEEAVAEVTGQALQTVETDWSGRFARPTGSLFRMLADSNLPWVLGALFLAVGGGARRLRFKRRLVEMEEEERELDALLAEWAARRSAA